jgi:putative transposase
VEYRHLKKEFWGRHLWARGYFACTTGNVADEVIKEYIENQEVERGRDDGFGVEGE